MNKTTCKEFYAVLLCVHKANKSQTLTKVNKMKLELTKRMSDKGWTLSANTLEFVNQECVWSTINTYNYFGNDLFILYSDCNEARKMRVNLIDTDINRVVDVAEKLPSCGLLMLELEDKQAEEGWQQDGRGISVINKQGVKCLIQKSAPSSSSDDKPVYILVARGKDDDNRILYDVASSLQEATNNAWAIL